MESAYIDSNCELDMLNLYKAIFEDAGIGCWIWDMPDNSTYISPTLMKMLGYTEEELPGSLEEWREVIHNIMFVEDYEEVLIQLKKHIALTSKDAFTQNIRFHHKAGGTVYTVCTGRTIIWNDEGFPIRMAGSCRDITLQVESEKELLRTEDLLYRTNQAALVGGWEIDMELQHVRWTKVTREIHEVDDDFEPTFETALNFFREEEDREKLRQAVRHAITTGQPYDLELPIVTAKRNVRWTRVIGHTEFFHGRCIRIYGAFQDITHSKNAEERLNVIFEYSTDAHFLLNENGIIDCNKAALTMSGCKSKEEMFSLPPATFSPEYQPDGQLSVEKARKMDRIAFMNGFHRFEWMHKKTTGEEFLVEVTLNPVMIGNSQVLLGAWHDISERVRSEVRVRRSEMLLNETQQLTHSGSWELDITTGKNYWSKETFHIFGIPVTEEGPSTNAFDKLIHPDDRENYLNAIRKALYKGEKSSFDLRIILHSGEIKHIHAIGQPYFDNNGNLTKLHGAVMDITQRKAAEEMIRQKEELLRTFIEYTPAAIAMLDKNMNYIAASNVWLTSYKLNSTPIIGKCHYDIFPEITDVWKNYHRRCLEGEVLSKEEDSFERIDGRRDWIKWEIRPWYEKENEIGGVVMFTEVITDQKDAKEALIKAKEQAEQAAIAKSQFLSTMSHEIRTPMNAVIGYTHLLMQNPRPDQVNRLRTLKFSAENLLVLINDILDFNKIEAGMIQFEKVDFSVKELISNIKEAMLQKASEKGIQLRLLIDEGLPEAVIGDPVRLGQVITNLVSNAVKFTNKGKVVISAMQSYQDSEKTGIQFDVMDTGIGIPKEQHKYIFESFTQASSDTTRRYGGTGLGLAITRRLLELQGSSISLKSEPGEGSTFSFELFFLNSSCIIQKPVIVTGFKDSLKGLRLLIAEDNHINVLLAQEFLFQWDVECDVAENGLIALELIQTNDYDLVLMDLQMPEMDGYETTKKVRELNGNKYRDLPIVALTASAMLNIQDKAFTVGMNDYISKPFNPDELYMKIRKYRKNR